ncbi:MAG: undecaprenyl-diphosphatase, partial [Solirubrobacterales bacterium]|nr:undecaprenyl-diphosphatase [Solirubrobacterales bacterium]
MNFLQSIILGLLQGLTEFLPISSSGHLLIMPAILGWDDPGAAFTATIQLGTEAAVLIYFRKDLWRIARTWIVSWSDRDLRRSPDARMGWYLVIATVPIALLGFAFQNLIETAARNLWLVSGTLIVFGLVLGLADRIGARRLYLA